MSQLTLVNQFRRVLLVMEVMCLCGCVNRCHTLLVLELNDLQRHASSKGVPRVLEVHLGFVLHTVVDVVARG